MSSTKTLKATIVSIFAAILILSPFSPMPANPQSAVAQTADCGVAAYLEELKYDSGIPVAQMKDQFGGCDQCQYFQGVLFSLPPGVSSSVLKKVNFYAGGGKANIVIHIMSAGPNGFSPWDYLTKNTVVPVSGAEAWYEVPMADVPVTNKFWVFLELADLKVAPFYDERRTGPPGGGYSWNGYNPDTLVPGGGIDEFKRAQGDFLIRAYIVPLATVGEEGKAQGYDYGTIQEAVDSVRAGWTILVHQGTYEENVTVNKSVTIRSHSGPANTTVQAVLSPYGVEDVIKITASCVTLSGFTIQGATDPGGAGVSIEDASGCVISGNAIQDNHYGIYVSEGSTSNILLENECQLNTIGIYIDGSENYISGNKLHGNTASMGPAVFLSSVASGNQLRFNSITVDPGTNPDLATRPQVYNQNTTEEVSAVDNWWGADSGPLTRGGEGSAVGEMVLFEPWLTKQPRSVETVAARAGPYTLDDRSGTSTVVTKQGTGRAFVSVADFLENPAGVFRYKTPEKWIDVLFSSTQGIDEVEIRVYYTADEVAGLKEGSLRLFWWNGQNQKWKVCSKSSVDKEFDYVWARLNLKTKPTPSELTGTMFAIGIPKGGFAWWLIPLIIVIVLVLLIAFRLIWVLLMRREGGYTSVR